VCTEKVGCAVILCCRGGSRYLVRSSRGRKRANLLRVYEYSLRRLRSARATADGHRSMNSVSLVRKRSHYGLSVHRT
jgi:hypothetical protein